MLYKTFRTPRVIRECYIFFMHILFTLDTSLTLPIKIRLRSTQMHTQANLPILFKYSVGKFTISTHPQSTPHHKPHPSPQKSRCRAPGRRRCVTSPSGSELPDRGRLLLARTPRDKSPWVHLSTAATSVSKRTEVAANLSIS